MSNHLYVMRNNLNAIKNIEDALWDIMYDESVNLFITTLKTDIDPNGVITLYDFKKENTNFECVLSGIVKYQNTEKTVTYFLEDLELVVDVMNIEPTNFHTYAVQIYHKIRSIIHAHEGMN